MLTSRLKLTASLLAVSLVASPLLAGEPELSEVQWQNSTTLRDEDGDDSDWIEVRNPGYSAINLSGYRLVENAGAGWIFPAVEVPPQGCLIVFASGKNRTAVDQPLHTNFALKTGDQLQLVSPGGAVLGDFSALPDAPDDVVYGIPNESPEIQLVTENAAVRWSPESTGNKSATPKFAARNFVHTDGKDGKNGLLVSRSAPGFAVKILGLDLAPTSGQELNIALSRKGFSWLRGQTIVPTLNFSDAAAGKLNFPGDQAFPIPSLPMSNLAPRVFAARGAVTVKKGGVYTVCVSTFGAPESGSVYVLQLGDTVIESGSGGWWPGPIFRAAQNLRIIGPPIGDDAAGNSFHKFTLPKAGNYPVKLWYLQPDSAERGLELSMAPGELFEFNNTFKLIGSTTYPVFHVGAIAEESPVGKNITSSVPAGSAGFFFRTKFSAPPATHQQLRLRVRYTDGFRAWIDGRLVAQKNAPIGSSLATRIRVAEERHELDEIDLPLLASELTGPATGHVLTVETLRAPGQTSLAYAFATLSARMLPSAQPKSSFLSGPTPGFPNGSAVGPPAAEPNVSLKRGVYRNPITVSLTSTDPNARIFFSLDGSPPVPGRGTLYRVPIDISSSAVLQAYVDVPGQLPSHTIVHSYIITSTQGSQSNAGMPEKWGESDADYEFDAGSVTNAGTRFPEALESIPTLSISMPVGDLFGPSGIYSNSDLHGKISAFDANVEWLYPRSGANWRDSASIRIKGEASRGDYFLKHGFRLDFGSGRGSLNRPVLGETERSRYNTLMLHGSFVDNVLTLGNKAQYIRDLWVRDTLRRMGQPAANGEFFHLYLNGLYWGLYHAGERSDSHCCAQYFGGLASDWDVIDSDGLIDGTNAGWADLMERTRRSPATQEDFDYVAQRFDFPAFCDYMLANIYAANTDWPGHNWYAARDKRSGVWRFITWDAEYSFDRPTSNLLSEVDSSLGGDPGDMFKFLNGFPAFRAILSDRIKLHFTGNGAMSPASADATWMNRANTIQSAVLTEYARWGKHATDFNGSPLVLTDVDWQAELTRLRTEWFPNRARTVVRQLRAIGLYPDVLPPAIAPSSGFLGPDNLVTLSNTGTTATIYYTTDGSDPLGSDGQPTVFATAYSAPFTLAAPAVVKARGWFDNEASALTQLQFHSGIDPRGLKFSEISFRPLIGNEEFVEIVNQGTTTLDLTGVQLTEAVQFTFPSGTTLAPGAIAVVVRDSAAFSAKYPLVPIAGVYTGALADEGERLTLLHPSVGILDRIAFRPFDPWATGTGSLKRTDYASAGPAAWMIDLPSPGVILPEIGLPPLATALSTTTPQTPPREEPFAITLGTLDPENQTLELQFPVEPGYDYLIQTTPSLDKPWEPLRNLPQINDSHTHNEPVPVSGPKAYFRVKRTLQLSQ